jgi:hypothetical protein
MAISIEFMVPAASGALDFAQTPAIFATQFVASGNQTKAINRQQALALLLDAGYGAPSGLDRTAYLGINAIVQARLQSYLRARWKLLWSLLAFRSGPPRIERHPVARFLDSTEKTGASFILGSLGLRCATEEWIATLPLNPPPLPHRPRALVHFWHFSVFSNPSVARVLFDAIALEGKSRPDYIARDTAGEWHSVEAKGTFDGMDWGPIKAGLAQAERLKKISHWEYLTPRGPAWVSRPVTSYACSLTYFAANGDLSIKFVDPPGNAPSDSPGLPEEEGPLTVEFSQELVELSQFYRACHQFRRLGRARRKLAESDDIKRPLVRWVTPLGLTEDFANVRLGIPEAILSSEARIRESLFVMGTITPSVTRLFNDLPSGSEAMKVMASSDWLVWFKELKDLKHEGNANGAEPRWTNRHEILYNRIIRQLEAGPLSKSKSANWHSVMHHIVGLNVFDNGQTSMAALLQRLQSIWQPIKEAVTSNQQHDGVRESFDLDMPMFKLDCTSHGLLVGSIANDGEDDAPFTQRKR